MGSLRRRLDRLEQQLGHNYEELRLPDGALLRYEPEEAVAAFAAAVDGQEHWLIDRFVSSGQSTGLPGLVRSLVLSRELVEERIGNGAPERLA